MRKRSFGTIVGRKNRRGFSVLFRWKGRRYRRQGGSTRKIAARKLARLEGMLARGDAIEDVLEEVFGECREEGIRFREAAGLYLERAKPDLRESTYDGYVSALRVACRARWTAMAVSRIEAKDIERWLTDRRSRGAAPTTCNRLLSAVSSVFRLMVRLGYSGGNPALGVRRYSERGREKTEYLTAGEAAALIASCEPVLREAAAMAVYCGLRRGEILGLRWRHVDLSRKQLVVEAVTAKSRRARSLPIPDPLLTDLRGLRESQKVMRADGEDPVFAFPGGRPLTVDLLENMFRRAVQRCREIPADKKLVITPHSLRRTFATLAVKGGAPILTVSRLLGHSSVDLTARHYARFAPSEGRGVVEDVARTIGEARPSEKKRGKGRGAGA